MTLKTLIAPDMMGLRPGADSLRPVTTHTLRPCNGMTVGIVIGYGLGGSLTRSQYKYHYDCCNNSEENHIPLSRFPFVLTGHESRYSSCKNSPILVKRQEKSPPGGQALIANHVF